MIFLWFWGFFVLEVVMCNSTDIEGDIRLVGGENEREGTVLINHRGLWGAVCDKGWDRNDAHVVCRQLGFPGERRALKGSFFGEGSFVICTSSVWALRNGDIRLVGGRRYHEGTVLIYYNGYWGAVCDKGWDRNDAHVVCRQLGYLGEKHAYGRSFFGAGATWMWMSYLRCYGNEKRLDKCRFAGWGRSNCYGGRHSAGVRCMKRKTTPSPTTTQKTTTTQRMFPTLGPNVLLADEPVLNKTELLDEESNGDGEVTTIRPTTEYTVTYSTLVSRRPIRSRLAAWRRQRRRKRRSTTVQTTLPPLNITTAAEKDMEIDRNNSSFQTLLPFEIGTNNTEGPGIRLNGGRFPEEGRVEVFIPRHGAWMAVCGDTWGLMEGMVVCKQLGYGYAKVVTATSFYGGDHMDKIYKHVKCTGKESQLQDCDIHQRENGVSCNFTSSIAGVLCTKRLPDLIPNITALEDSAVLRDHHLYYLQCAMEENCLASSAYQLRKNSRNWIQASRRLMRFSSVVHNRGTDDFRPNIPKERWDWHECHMHYHSMEVFATYDITDEHGNKVAEGHKASFCLEDSQCDPGKEKKFQCKGFADQGISVNCSDNYLAEIDCQWIDITDLSPGNYTFRVHVNPEKRVAELNFDNNLVTCDMYYSLFKFKVDNCAIGPDSASQIIL